MVLPLATLQNSSNLHRVRKLAPPRDVASVVEAAGDLTERCTGVAQPRHYRQNVRVGNAGLLCNALGADQTATQARLASYLAALRMVRAEETATRSVRGERRLCPIRGSSCFVLGDNAATVKDLATKYGASFEATARRVVEKRFRPCMLMVFRKEPRQSGDELEQPPTWSIRYCIASATFRTRYFERVSGVVPPEVVAVVTQPGRDIANGHKSKVTVRSSSEQQELPFTAEFFSNTDNILCLLTGG